MNNQETKEEIVEDTKLSREKLIISLSVLPGEIQKVERTILSHSLNVTAQEELINDIEKEIMSKITRETKLVEGVEKKIFTNDTARKAELSKRSRGDQELRKVKETLDHNKKEIRKSEIELKYLQNTFNATRYLVRLFTNKED